MNQTIFAALFACLAVESLTAAEDGSVTLSKEQLEAVNAALAKAKADETASAAEITRLQNELTTAQASRDALQEQVNNLQKADGDKTNDIEDGGGDDSRAEAANRMFKATAELV